MSKSVIKRLWHQRNKYKTEEDNILRLANSFNLTEKEVREILNKEKKE